MKIIKNKKLPNGLTLVFDDASKKITGDRCLVRLRCTISIPLLASMKEEIAQCGEAGEFIKNKMKDGLQHELNWERNFVDESDKDENLELLIDRADDTVAYLANDEFISRLFHKRITELKEAYMCQNDLVESDSGVEDPADFSACFSTPE